MIRRMWCNLKWNLFKFKQQFIEDCIDLLCPGYVQFNKDLLDGYLNLKHKYLNVCCSLNEAYALIDKLSKRKRRKK